MVDGKYENKTLWSYSDAVKTDGNRAQMDPLTGAMVEDPVKEMMSLDERIAGKLEEYGINIEEAAGLKVVDLEEEKLQREREKEKQA